MLAVRKRGRCTYYVCCHICPWQREADNAVWSVCFQVVRIQDYTETCGQISLKFCQCLAVGPRKSDIKFWSDAFPNSDPGCGLIRMTGSRYISFFSISPLPTSPSSFSSMTSSTSQISFWSVHILLLLALHFRLSFLCYPATPDLVRQAYSNRVVGVFLSDYLCLTGLYLK